MKRRILLVLLTSSVIALADTAADLKKLPAAVQRTINDEEGEVKKVKTVRRDGMTIYEVEYKGSDEKMLVAQDGAILDDDQGPGKGKAKGKGKGKAKGHYKHDKDRNTESEPERRPVRQTETAAAPAPPPSVPAATAPAVSTPAPTASAPAPSVATAPPAQPPASAAPSLTPAQVQTQLKARIPRINRLGENPKLAPVGLAAISKETGVPVAGLQTQLRSYHVGFSALYLANAMAKATGKAPRVFLQQRANSDWDRIAAANKFDLGTVLPNLERIQKAMETAAQNQQRKTT